MSGLSWGGHSVVARCLRSLDSHPPVTSTVMDGHAGELLGLGNLQIGEDWCCSLPVELLCLCLFGGTLWWLVFSGIRCALAG